MNDDFFAPATLRLAAGRVTIDVSNTGEDAHTFTIPNVVNAILQPGEKRTLTFTLPTGSQTFFCAYHGSMRGTITGQGGGSSAPAPPAPPPSTPAPGGAAPGHKGHAGNAARSVGVRCPATARTVTVSGALVAATRTRIVVLARKGAGTPGAYVGKRVFLARNASTASRPGLKAGQRVRVSGRCAAPRKPAMASRVALLPAKRPSAVVVLQLAADPAGNLKFDKSTLTARAGTITLKLSNGSPLPHNVGIDGYGYGKTVPKGGVSSVTAKLKPGRYIFFCAVPGHAMAGMKGTLVVR
jgi:plastocyanin